MTVAVAKIRQLSKKIGNKELVKSLNFDINQGEILGFLGPNGAGKTTTMRMMVGLMKMSGGDVEINGFSVKKNKEQALKHVGGIIENPEMYKFLSGYDNLVHFQRMNGPVNGERIKEVVKLVGLEKAIKNKVRTYSLGMKQRLGIAQALLDHPKLLILDEPTNGLDPEGIREIREYLKKLTRETGIAVFVSSHLLSEMELLCDRIVIIQKGQITDTEELHPSEDVIDKSMTVALTCEPQNKAVDILSEQGVIVRSEEDHLLIQTSYAKLPDIHRLLVNEGVNIYTIEKVRVSLEDRFLAKTKGGRD
ncbi:ATP-binding cassette domain-containing protein [Terrilactibacillus sp. BCM23-1]|uniref:ATP-binding cassette domain-containing protein n=1 Tax=Terrilactibacillus tamarindi TaxID=2599694 RepID=A0A6N8CN36_9BACI|nr:ABC transporter ATP-binding protein [Terrilactibacillus tamarindi]MTT30503.1 ATP-binding cassette domain-containing protein [Terrilactibacillus tamarindi]